MSASSAILLKCLAAILLVGANAFFVLFEFALVRARKTQLEIQERAKARSAALALSMHRRMDRYLAASQLGITMASLALGWVGESAFAQLFSPLFESFGALSPALRHSVSLAAAFTLITGLHIVLGEQVPKYLAIARAETSLRAAAPVMQGAYLLLWGPLMALNSLSNAILRLLGVSAVTESEPVFSKEELRLVLSQSHSEGKMSLAKVLLCENVLDLGDYTAKSIMVPLERVAMLDLKQPWEANRAVILERQHSRYPVCDGNPRKPVGYVYLKELLLGQMRDGAPIDLDKSLRHLPQVAASLNLSDLLPTIQRLSTNMAQVVEDGGKPIGIVTFEDVLEELVGEIVDEFEVGHTWRLADHLAQDDLLLNLEASGMEEVVAALVERLALKVPRPPRAKILDRVMQYERERFTTAGSGLALPHARLEGLAQTRIAYARLREGLDLHAADGKPVRHVFLILTPKENPREQLRALARISMLFTSDVLSAGFTDAETAKEIVEVVRAADSLTPLDSR
ncbi:MAG: DUF21 domain-containing protein [Spirochaetes bacterium]|nr:DUF21 domain-containing protein [Spirochaetota bacterium]